MEHIELLSRIVDAERRARQMSEDALKRREEIQSELAQKTAGLRESYFARADARLEKVRKREEALAAERISELDRVFDGDMEAIETAFARNREAWADKLFKMIAD
ncbi:MAG: hypothetical protein FWH06_06330 [Oscillospiraceae bacterium]|nr:hypothetical protein [Oscillospiraceae bacterium]